MHRRAGFPHLGREIFLAVVIAVLLAVTIGLAFVDRWHPVGWRSWANLGLGGLLCLGFLWDAGTQVRFHLSPVPLEVETDAVAPRVTVPVGNHVGILVVGLAGGAWAGLTLTGWEKFDGESRLWLSLGVAAGAAVAFRLWRRHVTVLLTVDALVLSAVGRDLVIPWSTVVSAEAVSQHVGRGPRMQMLVITWDQDGRRRTWRLPAAQIKTDSYEALRLIERTREAPASDRAAVLNAAARIDQLVG